MTIDADCHLAARSDGFAISADQLVALLDTNSVEKAICWPMAAPMHDITEDNTAIYEGSKRYPERFIPFGGVNPRLGLESALDEITRCHNFGFRGIKLNGARDGYFVDDPGLSMPIIEKIAGYGMAVAFHCGANDFERTHPYRVAKVAATFPETLVMMVHMGGAGIPSLHAAAVEFAAQHANIVLVDSEAQPNWILKAIKTLGASRVCYGSDAPFQLIHVMLAMHHALLRDCTVDERALVMGGNIQRLLSI